MRENEYTQAFEAAWAPFREAVARLSTEQLEQPTSSGWTAKEMLAHVAFWDESTPPVLTMMLRGGGMPDDWPGFASGYDPSEDGWPPFDVHNAREAEWARGQTAEAVVERLDKAHAYALKWLAALTPDELEHEGFRQYFYGDKPAHYDAHLPELTALQP